MASSRAAEMAKEHVEEIRREKFSIGRGENRLSGDLTQAVKYLSAELYAKDVHFLMELIQNAEDNKYPEGVDPSLEFVITSKDITNTGAPATLLVFNNEKGFSRKNIDSICSVGHSTKKGLRKRGYIGEKGIGFKSVFLITSQPYIFSNGYQIRFNEKPCQHCSVGYIVPEWVEDPTLSEIQSVYGSSTALPTTTLILPLKAEKVKPVKDQLSSVHPEVLLFLSKIKRLSVKEVNEDPRLNTVSAISISSEKNFCTLKSMDAESYSLHLTAEDTGINEDDTECGYHMWKQRFPVKQENKVDDRSEVEEWVITLAFPIGKRLKRGTSMPGIYSFLPTQMVTNFPFIIQADFILASSRENIRWDSIWNQGILDCVPIAFLDAFRSLVKSSEDAPVSTLPNQFRFLPINESSHPNLNHVRDAIKTRMMSETIIPCLSYTVQKLFCKPVEVFRLKPAFWSILNKARSEGVSFDNISSHGAYLLTSSFDKAEYNSILEFLEIQYVDYEWYAKCIASSNLVKGVSEGVYLQLLVFIAEEWRSSFHKTNIKNISLIKYVGMDGKVDLLKVSACTNKLLATDSDHISWLINWNTEFHRSTGQFFMPKVTQEAIESCSKNQVLRKWLEEEVEVEFVSVYKYAVHLSSSLGSDPKLAITYAHFLYNSLRENYLRNHEVEHICRDMPIVDNYGRVTTRRCEVLVPATGSKWVELIRSNPWRQHDFVELGEEYTHNVSYFGTATSGKELLSFLETYVGASDVPHLSPPNAGIPTMSSPLTRRNALLLLDWLYNLRAKRVGLPERFLSSIKNGSWLKISLSGCSDYRPPSESFILESSIGHLLQNGSVLVDIPLVDVEFYGSEIHQHKDDLKAIGVRFENKDACEFIGDRLMSIAASSKLTGANVVSILKFIQYLGANCIPSKDFVDSIRDRKWLRTSRGDMSPRNSVLFSHEWNAASQISDIPFIDQDYYGTELLSFKKELEMLGVVVSFSQNCYQLVSDNLKSSSSFTSFSSDALLLILRCIQKLESSDELVQAVKNKKCLKTNLGYRCPSECFLINPESEWGCLLRVFRSFPILDEKFYGRSIISMSSELKAIGVMVEFEDASKEFSRIFKQQVSSSSIRKENVFSFLECYRKLEEMDIKFPKELNDCILKEKWLRTKLGDYRSPNDCILFGESWEPVSPITLLPFIDDRDNFYGSEIHGYREELEKLGVTIDLNYSAKFVAGGLLLPQDCSGLTPVNVYALLDSVKRLPKVKSELLDSVVKKVSQKKWLKTHFGYKCPDECLLFCSAWDTFLKHNDGPFIDEEFYGSRIRSYEDELNLLGVITDTNKACKLLARFLESHLNFESIKRIYNFLSKFRWEPADEDKKKIWIPRGTENGEWVDPQDCVLRDKHNLFGDQLNVLEKFKYDEEILYFLAKVFQVNVHPSVEDYCKLWKKWECSGCKITHTECCAFWEFLVGNWNLGTEEIFKKNMVKIPVLDPNSDGIILSDKGDTFIGDDLFLMDLFQKEYVKTSSRPIFVWYPQPTLKSLTHPQLVDVYSKLGIRTLSESVQKVISDVDHVGFELVSSREKIVKMGLFKLVLGFLAVPDVKLEAEKRHEVVRRLLSFEAFETQEPMTVRYSLSLSSGEPVNVEAQRMIRWDKQNSKFFMQRMERSSGYKILFEYATHFAEVIADGVLWENPELVPQLSELIRLGFLVEFDEEAVEFLMKTKNLQLFLEDQGFISSTFSSQ